MSGGPDSTALMLLVAAWRERPPVLVATVDHGLRPEAHDEARLVAENAGRCGLPCRIMTARRGERPGNLQDWARRARYRLLAQAARDAAFDTIVTAHHLEDQAETLLLRLARGSGVYGLAAMRDEGEADGVRLARPLLGVPRAILAGISAASGLAVVADPSNADPRFDRVRIRSAMPLLAEQGLTAARLGETAARLGRAAAALDHYAAALLRERFTADAFGVVRGPAAGFGEVPEEVGLRALALILRAVGGAEYTPEIESVEAVRGALLAAGGGALARRTLHGVVISVRNGVLLAAREWGREGLPDVPVTGAATLVWDGRFRVAIPPAGDELRIGPLGRSDRRLRAPGADRNALRTAPGLFQNGTLVAVPDGVLADDEGAQPDRLAAECLVGRRLGISDSPPGPRP